MTDLSTSQHRHNYVQAEMVSFGGHASSLSILQSSSDILHIHPTAMDYRCNTICAAPVGGWRTELYIVGGIVCGLSVSKA